MMNTFMTLRNSLKQQAKQLTMPQLILNGVSRQKLQQLRFHHSIIMQARIPMTSDFFFRQLFDDVSSTYSYLLADIESKEAVLIDPGVETCLKDSLLDKSFDNCID